MSRPPDSKKRNLPQPRAQSVGKAIASGILDPILVVLGAYEFQGGKQETPAAFLALMSNSAGEIRH